LIPITLYIIILIDVVREKQAKLRKSLLIIGMTNISFWTSWFLISVILSFVINLIFFAFVYILQWELFINTPFPIMFVLFFLITIDLQLLAFLMSTLLNNVKTAYASAFCFIIVAMVIEFIFTVPFIYQIIFAENVNFGVTIFKVFLYLFCPYSFAKAYNEIATIASTKLNESTFMNMPGRKYEYSDLFHVNEGKMIFIKTKYKIPATYESYIWLVIDGIIYFVIIFYLDNVIESNRGKAKSPIFFIYDFLGLFGYNKNKNKEKIKEEEDISLDNTRDSTLGGFKNNLNNISDILEDDKIDNNNNINTFS
jgi:hypothetical protein